MSRPRAPQFIKVGGKLLNTRSKRFKNLGISVSKRAVRNASGRWDPSMAWHHLNHMEKEAYQLWRQTYDGDTVPYWWLLETGSPDAGVERLRYIRRAREAWQIRAQAMLEDYERKILA